MGNYLCFSFNYLWEKIPLIISNLCRLLASSCLHIWTNFWFHYRAKKVFFPFDSTFDFVLLLEYRYWRSNWVSNITSSCHSCFSSFSFCGFITEIFLVVYLEEFNLAWNYRWIVGYLERKTIAYIWMNKLKTYVIHYIFFSTRKCLNQRTYKLDENKPVTPQNFSRKVYKRQTTANFPEDNTVNILGIIKQINH